MKGPLGTRGAVVSCVIAMAVALGFGAAAEAGVPSVKVKLKVSRRADGPFGPDLRINLDEGQAKSQYLKVRSITGENEGAQLESGLLPVGVAVKYFTKNGKKITNAVFSTEGYDFTVKAGKPKLFRIKVKQLDPDVETCFPARVRDTELSGFSAVMLAVNMEVADCPT